MSNDEEVVVVGKNKRSTGEKQASTKETRAAESERKDEAKKKVSEKKPVEPKEIKPHRAIKCPECGAEAGNVCKYPSGYRYEASHSGRRHGGEYWKAAIESGEIEAPEGYTPDEDEPEGEKPDDE